MKTLLKSILIFFPVLIIGFISVILSVISLLWLIPIPLSILVGIIAWKKFEIKLISKIFLGFIFASSLILGLISLSFISQGDDAKGFGGFIYIYFLFLLLGLYALWFIIALIRYKSGIVKSKWNSFSLKRKIGISGLILGIIIYVMPFRIYWGFFNFLIGGPIIIISLIILFIDWILGKIKSKKEQLHTTILLSSEPSSSPHPK